MSWAAVGAAAVGVVGGYLSNKSANKRAGKGLSLGEDEIALQREGLDFSKQQYGDWKDRYDPVFDEMMARIDDGTEPDWNAIGGDINSSFDSARGMERREMRRYGIKPTDGAYNKSERDYAIGRSAAHSGIRNKARQDSAGIKYQRLAGIQDSLQGVGVAAGRGVSGAYGRAGSAMGNQANNYFNYANQTRASGANNAAGWGQAIGGIDWGKAWGQAKGAFSQGGGSVTGATVAGSGGQTPQTFYGVNNSDKRLKDNIVHIGFVGGIKIYKWEWNGLAKSLGIDGRTTGVLAQEHLDSGFVSMGDNGYLQIDYDGLFESRRAA